MTEQLRILHHRAWLVITPIVMGLFIAAILARPAATDDRNAPTGEPRPPVVEPATDGALP